MQAFVNPSMATVTGAQRHRFLHEIMPAASQICPGYQLQPQACVDEAAETSAWGSTALGYNWWNLPAESGDAGFVLAINAVPTGLQAGGGYAAGVVYLARFSSPFAAVQAWCEAICTRRGGC